MLSGVPVFHAEIIVNLNSEGEVVYYTNSYKKDIQSIDITPSISEQEAKQKSNTALKSSGEITFQEVSLFVNDFNNPLFPSQTMATTLYPNFSTVLIPPKYASIVSCFTYFQKTFLLRS